MTTFAPADIVIFGSIITPETLAGGARAGYVAVRDGIIVGVGERSMGAAPAASARRVIDLGSASVTSGLVDAHIHPIAGYEMTRGVDLTGIRTWDGVRDALRAEVAEHPDGWVAGWGFDPTAFEGRAWSNDILDGIADDRLLQFTFFDAHASLVSQPVLDLVGITGAETFADAGSVGLRPSGKPSGVLYENSAQGLVHSFIPEVSREDRVEALRTLFDGMAETGLTSGQMLDFALPDSLDILDDLENSSDLSIRLRVSPWLQPGAGQARLEELLQMQGRHGRRWHVRGVKLIIDGTIDNSTAWLFEPDSQGRSTSSLWLHPDEYVRALSYFDSHGVPTTTHAIGDKGVSFVARAIRDNTAGVLTHRIEHIETLPDDVLAEIAESHASTSMQPTHCTHFVRADGTDNWSERLGPERAARGWRIRDLRDNGITVALGSDWPIAPYDPKAIMVSARLRRVAGSPEAEPVGADQTISAARALEGYTSQYWQSVGEPGGQIVEGARADLAAFDRDPLGDADAFAEAAVLLTMIDGEIVVDHT
ncbi:hypothetical protein B7R21_17530 [Subtercola boreus]|uniref:Amidohydrolase 3 domain-containing protein n=1 Tax=Subtercola boreus TaxID=120213 RepID=A0A3E0VC08_9MICO|nr:amidohydrolase family protein [Subtercola boreus]RFA06920.1 hypothetical protein B7R21_17530 [Subtercola boreus]